MKRAILAATLLGSLVFGVCTPAHALESEHIQSFDTNIAVHTDATVNVQETIVYVFADDTHHGIYRDIPISYKTKFGNTSIGITNITVTDEKGESYPYTTSHISQNLRIKIGSADTTVSGTKTYVISYTVSHAINYFDSYDELYWNGTGNSWTVPIDAATETISLPLSSAVESMQAACYEGVYGSTESCTIASSTNSLVFSTTRPLRVGEGLTAALGFSKGVVYQPTRMESVLEFLKNNAIAGLPVLVFFGMLYVWYTKGRDPTGRGTIVPEYDSPDDITPAELYTVLHEYISNKPISAQIISLAVRGNISITKLTEKVFFVDTTDYRLTKLKDNNSLSEADTLLIDGLFETGKEVKLSDLKNVFYKKIPAIKKATISSVIKKGYFTANPVTTRLLYMGIGFAVLFLLLYVAAFMSFVYSASIALSGFIIIGFGYFMPKVTASGAILKERIEGLKMYLDVAEKDRINFHNAPEKNPALFEKLLPFAMVLGVETAWAKQFEGIYTQNPSWYSDTGGGIFNPVFFMNDLHSFSSTATSALASAPGGSSGSSGGGSSGGGFGGGGGGSW